MARSAQNIPRSLKTPRQARPVLPKPAARLGALTRTRIAIISLLLAGAVAVATVFSLANSAPQQEQRVDQEVAKLLTGIPQHDHTLGYPSAPMTLEVFADLKDPDSRNWFDNYLPAILQQDVRTGRLQLRFHSYKTNTFSPTEFVREQTAALSAGAQNKLWNYADLFYHQQRNAPKQSEFEPYATNRFLEDIARQVPGLGFARWLADQHTERREELPSEESKAAREYQLHVTPSFRIGRTGEPLTNYSGSTILKYGGQHPISLIKATDLQKSIKELDPAAR
jgi:Thioredoxin